MCTRMRTMEIPWVHGNPMGAMEIPWVPRDSNENGSDNECMMGVMGIKVW